MTKSPLAGALALLLFAPSPLLAQGSDDAFTPHVNAYELLDVESDGAGGVWMASNGGALRLDVADRSWRSWPRRLVGGPAANTLTTVSVGGDGTVWVGTAESGVSTYEPALDRWTDFLEIPDPRIRVVRAFGTQVFIGTQDGLALRFRPRRTDLCNEVASGCEVPSYLVNDFAVIGDTLWVATQEGLGRYNGDTWDSPEALPEGSVGPDVRSLATFEGTLWGLFPRGVRRLGGGGWESMGMEGERLVVAGGRLFAITGGDVREWTGAAWADPGVPDEPGFAVRDLAIVDDVFVLAGPGLVLLWREGAASFEGRLVPPGPQVAGFHRGAAVDADCGVWLGNQEGLLGYDGEAWSFTPKGTDGLDAEWVFTMTAVGSGVAIGHCCCDTPPRCRLDVRKDGVFVNTAALDVWALALDGAGRLWAGTNDDGVLVLAPGLSGGWDVIMTITNATTGGALRSNSIRAIAVTAEGTYFGHYEALGIDYWPHRGNLASGANGSNWTRITTASGLADGSISSIAVKGSDVWVGTSTALHRLNGATVIRDWDTAFADVPGDLSRIVRAIVPDDLGGVWCATDNGLLYLRARDDFDFERFGMDNASLPSDDVLSGALNPCDGSVWFGAAEGIVRVDPRKLTGREGEVERFIVRPNPFDPSAGAGRVFVSYATADGVIAAGERVTGAEVFDITGRPVGRFRRQGEEWTWDGTNVNGDLVVPGIYLVAVDTNRGGRETLKLGVLR